LRIRGTLTDHFARRISREHRTFNPTNTEILMSTFKHLYEKEPRRKAHRLALPEVIPGIVIVVRPFVCASDGPQLYGWTIYRHGTAVGADLGLKPLDEAQDEAEKALLHFADTAHQKARLLALMQEGNGGYDDLQNESRGDGFLESETGDGNQISLGGLQCPE
jgi:hypothetical protein